MQAPADPSSSQSTTDGQSLASGDELAELAGMLASIPDRAAALQERQLSVAVFVPCVVQHLMQACTADPLPAPRQAEAHACSTLPADQAGRASSESRTSDTINVHVSSIAGQTPSMGLSGLTHSSGGQGEGTVARQNRAPPPGKNIRGSGFVDALLSRLCLRGHASSVARALWAWLLAAPAATTTTTGPCFQAASQAGGRQQAQQQLAAAIAAVSHAGALERLLEALLAGINWPEDASDAEQHVAALTVIIGRTWERLEARCVAAATSNSVQQVSRCA